MITMLSNVLTGRFRYWNENCNKYFAILYGRADHFPPAISPLFKRCTAASYELIDVLVGPDHGKKRIFDIDPKDISMNQYKEMTHYCIWFFVLFLSRNVRDISEPFIDACTDFIGEGHRDKLRSQILDVEKPNPEQLVRDLSSDLAQMANIGTRRDLMDWVKVMIHVRYAQEAAWQGYITDVSDMRKNA
jgi:hypothetical protein